MKDSKQTNESIHSNQIALEQVILNALNPYFLNIEDESKNHARGEGTHYKVIIVSSTFVNLSLVERQRLVHKTVHDIYPALIHSLTLRMFSPDEWNQNPEIIPSPKCAGVKPD